MNLCVMTRISFIGVRIREVFPGSGRVTGIQVDNNYIALPGEIFKDITEAGIITVYGDFMSNIFSDSIYCILLF